jgi:hypothetical protein
LPRVHDVRVCHFVLGNLVILFVLAALAGAGALLLFATLGRVESRAHWDREKGLARSRRLERRAFLILAIFVGAITAAGLAIYLLRTPPCKGKVVVVTGPGGVRQECLCEQGRLGACFDTGP